MARLLPDTKFYIPAPRDAAVARPRLLERLDRGARGKLVVVSAPPGFGKTALLAEWLAVSRAPDRAVAWLSLDPTDNEPVAFWTGVAAALVRAAPELGGALSVLQEGQTTIDVALTALMNDLARAKSDVLLVLDDFHVIEATEVGEQMAFLLEHLPSSAHIVMTTRADPALPLARLRARGELLEIRAADLRFTRDEAATYLQSTARLHLDAAQVDALEERTEGWIAALQLAALSLQDREDVDEFIASFAGDDRFVVDYLAEEVLGRLPDDVRDFLLQTSILERLTASLCDAVTEGSDGQAMLELIDRRNLFVMPLDSHREWYRYHHLFAEVLGANLRREHPEHVSELHRRACSWFERQGDRREAIRHALAGDDYERAADLIELALPEVRQARQDATLRLWFGALPDELYRRRPVLAVGYVGALMANGDFGDVDARLTDAERWLEPRDGTNGPTDEPVVRDELQFRRLPTAVAMYRAAEAQMHGDRKRTETFARRALELAGDDDPLGRGAAAGFLALSHWGSGDLAAAHDEWADAQASLERAGHTVDAISCYRPLAEIRAAQGRLHEAMRTYEDGLRVAAPVGGTILRGAADLHVGMSELCLEWNKIDQANDHLRASDELGEGAGLPQNPYRWRVAMAQLRLAAGDPDEALTLLDDAERVFVSEYYPLLRPIPAQRARIHAAQGRLREAEGWARDRGPGLIDGQSYLTEYERITLARVGIAQGSRTHDIRARQEALELLDRLLAAADAGGRERSVIEILVLKAVAEHQGGRGAAGLEPLGRALTLAESEGYVRTFVAEGPPMAALLAAAVKHQVASEYAGHLLHAMERSAPATAANERLAEPLSERELEVLRLLATDLDGPGIADELVVALSTVRSHIKRIYAKLGVSSRQAAVRRGDELGLMTRGGRR